jgi:hypothetical protein
MCAYDFGTFRARPRRHRDGDRLHVIDELAEAPRISAEDAIRTAQETRCVRGVSSESGRG